MVVTSRHLLMPERERANVRSPGAGHAEVLDAWLGSGSRLHEAHEAIGVGSTADWDAPRRPVELAYDTADQGLPSGVRAVVREGSRRLMFEAEAYEILLRVASNRSTEQYELAGQVLFEGLPLPGATVRLELDGPGTTISTDGAGGFRLPPLAHGAYGLSIAVTGAVLTVPPIALH
jgi:hypothetical protein